MYEDFYDNLSQKEQTNLEILLEEFKSKTKQKSDMLSSAQWMNATYKRRYLYEKNKSNPNYKSISKIKVKRKII